MEALDEARRQLLIQISKQKKESVAGGGLFTQGVTAELSSVFCQNHTAGAVPLACEWQAIGHGPCRGDCTSGLVLFLKVCLRQSDWCLGQWFRSS